MTQPSYVRSRIILSMFTLALITFEESTEVFRIFNKELFYLIGLFFKLIDFTFCISFFKS
jgi:hypothetical protein